MRHVIASIEHVEAFASRCRTEAARVGQADATELTVLGDGAEGIWNLASDRFAGAEQVLDFSHASE